MKTQRLLLVLTLTNLALLIGLIAVLAQRRAAAAEELAPMLRGRGLQIVDESGKVRASIAVLPPTKQQNGETSAETVLLRLITEQGRPSVKLAASEESAGISLAGPTGTKNTWVTMGSKGTGSWLTLKDENGREQNIKP
jgi:hypothetical protein